MNIKLIIAGLLSLAVVGGGTYYVVNNTGEGDANLSSQQTAQTEQQEKVTVASKASLAELLERGDDLQCSFNYTDEGGDKTEGTFYISNERMRGDFTYDASDEGSVDYGMIRNDTKVFTWDKAKKEGFSLDVSDYESEADKTQEDLKQQAIDQNQKYNVDCDDWNVDASKFEKPGDVKFVDLSAQLDQIKQKTQEASQGGQEQLQNACSQIADPEVRDACEKNL